MLSEERLLTTRVGLIAITAAAVGDVAYVNCSYFYVKLYQVHGVSLLWSLLLLVLRVPLVPCGLS